MALGISAYKTCLFIWILSRFLSDIRVYKAYLLKFVLKYLSHCSMLTTDIDSAWINWMPIANIYKVNCFHTHRLRKQYWVLFIMSGAINLLPALYWICYQKPGKRVKAKTKWANLILFGRGSQISLPAGFLSDWESLKHICSTPFSWGVCTCTWILSALLPLVLRDAEPQWALNNFLFSNKEAHCLLTCAVSKSNTHQF